LKFKLRESIFADQRNQLTQLIHMYGWFGTSGAIATAASLVGAMQSLPLNVFGLLARLIGHSLCFQAVSATDNLTSV
jgi:hypothetical protein